MDDPKSFLASLFDFSFGSFIVPKLIRLMYVVGLVFGGLYSLSMLGVGFASSFLFGILALIFVPILFLVMAVMVRSYCELILVQFSLLQNVERIAQHLTGGTGPAADGGGPVDGRGIVHSPSGGASVAPAPQPASQAPAAPTTDTASNPNPSSGWGSSNDSGDGWT